MCKIVLNPDYSLRIPLEDNELAFLSNKGIKEFHLS